MVYRKIFAGAICTVLLATLLGWSHLVLAQRATDGKAQTPTSVTPPRWDGTQPHLPPMSVSDKYILRDRVRLDKYASVVEFRSSGSGNVNVICDPNQSEWVDPHQWSPITEGNTVAIIVRPRTGKNTPTVKIRTPEVIYIGCAGDIHYHLSNAHVKALKVGMAGGSSVQPEGSAELVDFNASGSPGFFGKDFIADRITFGASGSCNGELRALNSLTVDVAGSGRLKIIGHPKREKVHTSGTVKIERS